LEVAGRERDTNDHDHRQGDDPLTSTEHVEVLTYVEFRGVVRHCHPGDVGFS
jgi:hypothetical protein